MTRNFSISLACVLCLCMVVSFSTVSADTGVEVLIYTGKIAVTTQNDIATTYAIPQEVKTIPTNTVVECIDGVAILKVGEVQVVMEAKDKLKLASTGNAGRVDMVCMSGEIEAVWGEDFYRIAHGQSLGLNSEGTPISEVAGGKDSPIRAKIGSRAKLSADPIMDNDPEEPVYTSPHF
ncbi:MAG: hypothetical protein ACMUIS_02700 [bacterium]